MRPPAPQPPVFGAAPTSCPKGIWGRGLQSILSQPGEGPLAWGTLASPEERGSQLPGLFTAMQGTVGLVALGGHCQELAEARPGQQLEHVLVPSGAWNFSMVLCLFRKKTRKTTDRGLVRHY